MPLDPDAQALLDAMIKAGRPQFEALGPVKARQQMRDMRAALKQPVPEVAEVRDIAVPSKAGAIPVRLYRGTTASGTTQPLLVFFHGGGWVFGDIETHDNLCRALANSGACTVISVDYRLAPEHKFPAAVDDCFAVVTWAHANAAALGVDATRIAVGGDSAGGNLAAVVAMRAQQAGSPRISMQILFYPVTDLAMDTASYAQQGKDYNLTATAMRWFRDLYLNNEAEFTDWRVSPLKAKDLAKLPPTYLAIGGCDPLHDEAVAFAKALDRAGVPVTLREYPGQMHGFASMSGFLRSADEVIAETGAMLRTAWGSLSAGRRSD